MPSERPRQRLQDIVDNIDRVTEHVVTAVTSETGDFDAKTRDAVERCLERISEAAKKLGVVMEQRQPNIPWQAIRGLGNTLRHQYDEVDDSVIRDIVRDHLVPLRAACLSELGTLLD
jgi:uncharacterized protein with HEPN domain